jgi:SAM-dependent methyltransferase
MTLLERIHGGYVHGRRSRVLAGHLAALIPPHARVLDVGCGDGLLDGLILEQRPDVDLEGIDVAVRPRTCIPVAPFDGREIPHADGSFDAVQFVDVLHHTDDPLVLLREAARVARHAVLIKDHLLEGFLAGTTLRFMDRVSNTRHGVVLPFNYWTRRQWPEGFARSGLAVETWKGRLGMYPWPAGLVFGRGLHFVARLTVNGCGRGKRDSIPRHDP